MSSVTSLLKSDSVLALKNSEYTIKSGKNENIDESTFAELEQHKIFKYYVDNDKFIVKKVVHKKGKK